jgi:hypothetical protein
VSNEKGLDGTSERSGCYSWSGLQLTLIPIPAAACASPKSHAHQPPTLSSGQAQRSVCDGHGQQPAKGREHCLSYVGAFRSPQRQLCHGMNAPSPAQHALALARASILPPAPVGAGGWWMADGLFVCNSHIDVHGKEAMTRTGRRDAMRCDAR